MGSSQSVWFAGESTQTDETIKGSTTSSWISNVRSFLNLITHQKKHQVQDTMDSYQSVWFAGESIQTEVTSRGSTISSWISDVRSSYNSSSNDESLGLIVGFDCKSNPNKPPATLQLCFETKCLIIQLLYLDCIPKSLTEFLEDSDVCFVGVEGKQKAAKIREEYGFDLKNAEDLVDTETDENPGLEDLALKVLGVDISKPDNVKRSDWQAKELNAFQIKSACVDAYASYKLGDKTLKELEIFLDAFLGINWKGH